MQIFGRKVADSDGVAVAQAGRLAEVMTARYGTFICVRKQWWGTQTYCYRFSTPSTQGMMTLRFTACIEMHARQVPMV